SLRTLAPAAQTMLKRTAEMSCLHPDELYGGKLCAALDRQNPRDFFDLYMLFKNGTYTRSLHETFMVYLLSSNRPISEMINPKPQDLTPAYQKLFSGMTSLDVDCHTLEVTRD